nr:aspartate/glutamate racemase family protein [Agrobacterium sp. T29]
MREEISLALKEDRAEAIVLGCAGMADLAAELRDEFGVPVVDASRRPSSRRNRWCPWGVHRQARRLCHAARQALSRIAGAIPAGPALGASADGGDVLTASAHKTTKAS